MPSKTRPPGASAATARSSAPRQSLDELYEEGNRKPADYDRWFVPAQAIVGEHLATFQEFPPRQKPGSFSVDQAMEKLMNQNGSN